MTVQITGLNKNFGKVPVLRDLSIKFSPESISILLGASGCGKTTTLRCLAGLERPDSGEIIINGKVVFSSTKDINLPAERRNLGMVFQSYAIWPHMTVFENVAVPLKAQGATKENIQKRVLEILEMLGLAALAHRSATALSGGQQQRVAIARCIAATPQLILLDEPLSNLDANLRIMMRSELKLLQRRHRSTMVFVTHDQEEAMSIADEIFLFESGRLAQQGPPDDLYRYPVSRYVAEFLGRANFIPAISQPNDIGTKIVAVPGGHIIANVNALQSHGDVVCMIRPEAWQVTPHAQGALPGRVLDVVRRGETTELRVSTPIGNQCVVLLGYERVAVDDQINLSVSSDRVHILASM